MNITLVWFGFCVPGVFNAVCDIPAQTIRVSSSLSPHTVVSLVRRVMPTAHIINIAEAMPTAVLRATSYDDMYSYDGRTGYIPPYAAPYGGRSYDNEFRPGRYNRY
jgi:hypothetical protein